jgi:hypothetical protein
VSQETQPSISTAHNITRLFGIEHKDLAAPGISVRCKTPFDHSNETGAQVVRIEQENEENVSRVPRRRNGARAKGVRGPAVEYDPSLAPFETQGRQEAAQALRFASRFSGQAGQEGGAPARGEKQIPRASALGMTALGVGTRRDEETAAGLKPASKLRASRRYVKGKKGKKQIPRHYVPRDVTKDHGERPQGPRRKSTSRRPGLQGLRRRGTPRLPLLTRESS